MHSKLLKINNGGFHHLHSIFLNLTFQKIFHHKQTNENHNLKDPFKFHSPVELLSTLNITVLQDPQLNGTGRKRVSCYTTLWHEATESMLRVFWRLVEDKRPPSNFGHWAVLEAFSWHNSKTSSLAGSASLTFSKIFPVSISIAGWKLYWSHGEHMLCVFVAFLGGDLWSLNRPSRQFAGSPSDFTDCVSGDESGRR